MQPFGLVVEIDEVRADARALLLVGHREDVDRDDLHRVVAGLALEEHAGALVLAEADAREDAARAGEGVVLDDLRPRRRPTTQHHREQHREPLRHEARC